MALQGTLDTFSLPDVLRLLASTRKTGRLQLSGDRGTGDVWLDDGAVVAVAAAGTADLSDGLFELLRARDGAFTFEPGEAPSTAAASPGEVESLLASAEEQLVEWRAIEAVVPSLDARVTLASTLPEASVTIDAGTWQLVTAVGRGMRVGELRDALGEGEVSTCRRVRDLVELGLGEVTVEAAPAPAPVAVEPEVPVLAVAPVPADAVVVGPTLAVSEDDEPVNRGLLTKFLGSAPT